MSTTTVRKSETAGISERILELVGEAGNAQRLADRAGLNSSTVLFYLPRKSGRVSEPSAAAIVKIARAMEVSLHWLLTGDGPKKHFADLTPIDRTRLAKAIIEAETILRETRRKMSTEKKAKLIVAVYGALAENGIDHRKILELVRAVA
jgi:transcriptional regulator with XRE-family HTH domain